MALLNYLMMMLKLMMKNQRNLFYQKHYYLKLLNIHHKIELMDNYEQNVVQEFLNHLHEQMYQVMLDNLYLKQ